MKLVGEPIFSRDAKGKLCSRIGTLFLRTPGLVTTSGIHATQRMQWIHALNREREASGGKRLSDDEINAEMANSVDLLFDEQHVLIRPDPNAMPIAFLGDELLQTMVSKSAIRFLNIQDARVRTALCQRGENWRMSALPRSSSEMNTLIERARVGIGCESIYFYNQATGTRFLTVGALKSIMSLPDDSFRCQIAEIAKYSAMRNRLGHPEVDIFPQGCKFTRQAFEALDVEGLGIKELRYATTKLLDTFDACVPPALFPEGVENMEWRNQMCSALLSRSNAVVTDEIVPGISPEFYMQIEWLPGCRVESGELIFDEIYAEAENHGENGETHPLYDLRAKGIIQNYLRVSGNIQFINIGRIAHSMSTRIQDPNKRSNVYVVQLKESGKPQTDFYVLRFQKWCMREHLDRGKSLLQAFSEAADYTDYIMDRRLSCRQLGMNLPARYVTYRIREVYRGLNKEYEGARIWVTYFERDYVHGIVTDKIHERRYANPAFNCGLARLLGGAAAVNIVVGRAHRDGRSMFDDGDEVIVLDENGLPAELIVSDHTGTFVEYNRALIEFAADYAAPVNARAHMMPNAVEFADIYLDSFRQRLERIRHDYFTRQRAFDYLFRHLPLDPMGNIAYRWQCVLKRLAETDVEGLTQAVRNQINR